MSIAEAIYRSVQMFCLTLLLIMMLHLAIPMFELWLLFQLRQAEAIRPRIESFNLAESEQQRL